MRVVLLTRTSRPSGAKMAQALLDAGVELVGVVAERRMRLVLGKRGFLPTLRRILFQHGPVFLIHKVGEQFRLLLRRLVASSKESSLSIEEWGLHSGVPVLYVDDHNNEETQDRIRSFKPDLLVVCNTRRLVPETFRITRRGALNLHLSLLPKYAGVDSIFWALYHREKEVGFTIHQVSEKLDAGQILYQEKLPLEEISSEDKLYEKLVHRGCEGMATVVLDFDSFAQRGIQQDAREAAYFSWPNARQRRWYARYQKDLTRGKPLKVLHLITRMVRGGAQENTLATVRGLTQRGYDAILATGPSLGPEGQLDAEMQDAQISCVSFPYLVREPSLFKDIRTLFSLARWMRKEKCILVHTHTSKAGVLGRVAAWMAGVPVVVHTPHGHVFGGYFSSGITAIFKKTERLLAPYTNKFIALTPRERDEHLERGIGKKDQFTVIPSGVRVEDFDPDTMTETLHHEWNIPKDAKVVGTLARLVPVKGVEYFLASFRHLFASHKDVYWVLVGDGFMMKRLKDLADRDGVSSRVIFAGYRKDVARALATMDVFVMASLNEGMGRAIVQAGLMRKPIVASAVSGIRDLIRHEQNGLLVKPTDTKALAQAILRLLSSPREAMALGVAARRAFLEDYQEVSMVNAIERLYKEAMGDVGIPASWLVQPYRARGDSGIVSGPSIALDVKGVPTSSDIPYTTRIP